MSSGNAGKDKSRLVRSHQKARKVDSPSLGLPKANSIVEVKMGICGCSTEQPLDANVSGSRGNPHDLATNG